MLKRDPLDTTPEEEPQDIDFDLLDPWFGIELPKPPGFEERPRRPLTNDPHSQFFGPQVAKDSANLVKPMSQTPFLPTADAMTHRGVVETEEEYNPFALGN